MAHQRTRRQETNLRGAQSQVAMPAAVLPDRYVPATVVEIPLERPLGEICSSTLRNATGDLLLVPRLCGQPLGFISAKPGLVRDPASLAAVLRDHLGEMLLTVADQHGLCATAFITEAGLVHEYCPAREQLEAVAKKSNGVSIVLCTHRRPEQLRRCLDSLTRLEHPKYEVVVVDNAPDSDAVADACEAFKALGLNVVYALEPHVGLSVARNTGVLRSRFPIIAFIDDDERADPMWLLALEREFQSNAKVGVVSGLVAPAELRTQSQVDFEQFGGHSKGRGFSRVLFDDEYTRRVQSPLYPLPAFGVGANMAFRRSALETIGMFDPALGAGTLTQGSEDTLAFSEAMLRGWYMIYSPSALTWHYHRDSDGRLVDQLFGYGVGLGAFYSALILRAPWRLFKLVRLAPRALADVVRPTSPRNARLQGLPPEVSRANLRGLVQGPVAYLRARRRVRRLLARPGYFTPHRRDFEGLAR